MKILVAYDGSVCADTAVEDLRRAGLPQDADALTLSVATSAEARPHASGSGTKDSWKTKLASAQALAEAAANRMQSYFPQWRISSEALWGSPSDVILKTSGWWRPDLLVIGCHEFAHADQSKMGCVSLELVHQARCSVRVSRAGVSRTGPVLLVIGNDGSRESEALIEAVARRSWPGKTEAQVMSFVESPGHHREQGRERLNQAVEDSIQHLQRAGLTVSGSVVDGNPRQELVREAERLNADTIFVGGSRESGRFLLGGISTAVVTKARCTVEVVR